MDLVSFLVFQAVSAVIFLLNPPDLDRIDYDDRPIPIVIQQPDEDWDIIQHEEGLEG